MKAISSNSYRLLLSKIILEFTPERFMGPSRRSSVYGAGAAQKEIYLQNFWFRKERGI